MALFRQSNRVPPLGAGVSGALFAALALTALAPAHAAVTPKALEDCTAPWVLDGTTVDAKLRKGGDSPSNFADVKLTRCDMEVAADHARTTSLDFDNSTWTLTGNVHIRMGKPFSKLSSNEAVVLFKNSEIQRATFKGDPAEFEQQRTESDVVTRGHARQIVYEAVQGTVTLQDDVFLTDGPKQVTGPRLVYDIRKAEVGNTHEAASDGGGNRIHIVITPPASKDPKKDSDKKPAPTPP